MNDFFTHLNDLWRLDDLWNLRDHWQSLAVWGTALLSVALIAYVLGWLIRAVIGGLIARIAAKTETLWDDYLFEKRFFARLGNFLPAVASYFLFSGLVTPGEPHSLDNSLFLFVSKLILLWMCFSGTSFFVQFINNVEKGFLVIVGDKKMPIRSYVQVVKLFLFLVAGILVVSVILDQNPIGILTGLGALTAVLLLVFKDSLLGLVASFQLNSNDLVQIGDWIEFPGQNIDGEVTSIALNVVKIRSADNTVYSLPTYNLVSVPFKNWRNVNEVGARRLKIAFPIDSQALALVAPAQEKSLKKAGFWKVPDFLPEVTNAEAFRFWAQDYLESHGDVHPDLVRLVKIGDPVGRGLPVEMVFYTRLTGYPDWEHLHSRLLCHYLAALPTFGLKVFQDVSGVFKG
jgi:miniconductance mechanosensitive channel